LLSHGSEALQLFGPDYDTQVESGEVDAMCAKLAHYTAQKNAQRIALVKRDI
jgi:hypothetical protein